MCAALLAPRAAAARELTAAFPLASYAPNATALLRIDAGAGTLSIEPLTAFAPARGRHGSVFDNPPVAPAQSVPWRGGAGSVSVRVGNWPSGVYFLRVRSASAQAVAPLVVRPGRLGGGDVAVVVPTLTWQAYNRRGGQSWYVCACVRTVRLDRPYLDAGVPYNFAQYDRGFLAWVARRHARVDFLSDQDLDRLASGSVLRRLYRLVIFEGHGEYVTSHMYDVTQRYRDLGGHLMFVAANDFFRDVVVRRESMTLVGTWRARGRPEAALIGAQYVDWFRNRYPNRRYVVRGTRRLPWLFAGTGLSDGATMRGTFGIEIDARAPSSPRGTAVVAEIPDIFPGETAQMTYYSTRRGAEVFDAGTLDFGGAADDAHDVGTLLGNLWAHMTAAPSA